MKYPFDCVSLAFVSKSYSLTSACIALVRAGHTDEAYGLSRSLVECSLILRYVTIDRSSMQERAKDFFWYSKAYKNYWLYWCRTSGNEAQLAEAERYAEDWKLDGNPEPARQGWSSKGFTTFKSQQSDHPIDGSWFSKQIKSSAYAVDYFQTSQFVHCSQPALDSFFPSEGAGFEISDSSGEIYATQGSIAFILVNYTHLIIRYVMFGLEIDATKPFDELFARALRLVR